MKKTEWFYESNTNKWWMVTIVTNADKIPTIKLGNKKPTKKQKAIIHNIDLVDDNKKLWWTVLGLCGALGISLALTIVLLIV